MTNYGKGYIDDSVEDIEDMLVVEDMTDNITSSSTITNTTSSTSLPSSVDLSTSKYFPPVGSQSIYNSCASFATVYYQFTYEVNKMLDRESNSNDVIYSPRYIYNFINFGSGDNGTTISGNYKALKTFGALSLTDFPYIKNGYSGFEEWCTDVNIMREALRIRVSEKYSLQITDSEDFCVITSNTDTDLNAMKTELYNGKLLVAGSCFNWNSKSGYGDDLNKIIAYRCSSSSEGHAFTIVGYDDNIECDVNGNGTIEACEKGAFKAVNSWGTYFNQDGISSTDGFFWILYDSLNGISANTYNDWESSLSGTRCSAIKNANAVFAMNVEEQDVYFVGELHIDTTEKYKFSLYGEQGYRVLQMEFHKTTGFGHDGTIVFDYKKAPISDYIHEYEWRVKYHDSYKNKSASFYLTDDLGNRISDWGVLNGENSYVYNDVAISMGDLNYDGIVNSSDAQLVLQYAAKIIELSNVQMYLGDINVDGTVNAVDANLILNM